MPQALDRAEAATQPIHMSALNELSQNVSRKIFLVLTVLLKGPPLLVLRQCERGNGVECWRLLHIRYEKATMNRLATMLQTILKPKPFPQDTTGFETALQDWELLTARWESMAVDTLNDAVRRQSFCLNRPRRASGCS